MPRATSASATVETTLGAALGQRALVEIGMRGEQPHGDGLPEHRVAEELEALVVRDPGRARTPTTDASGQATEARGRCRLRASRRALCAQTCDVSHVAEADQTSATLRPLYSRNSSVPCESVTTFAWCGRL